jgi:hypothetical protein
VLAAVPRTAKADIGLGLLSLDELVPGAVNTFTVNNFTLIFNSVDFPVSDTLIFQNSTLTLTRADGIFIAPIFLGDLGPGSNSDPSLEFGSDVLFTSAEFTATLSSLTFGLFDGTTFAADTAALDVILLPSSGNSNLVAGVDLVPITVSGSTAVSAVPEPSAWLLLVTAVGLTAALQGRKRRHDCRS